MVDTMRIFKTTWFARYSRKQGIHDADLCEAIRLAEAGKIDADLGGGVIKMRLPAQGKGKSGGYRTIIIFKHGHSAFYVYGFAKSDRANITASEVKQFKALASKLLNLDSQALQTLTDSQQLEEIHEVQKRRLRGHP